MCLFRPPVGAEERFVPARSLRWSCAVAINGGTLFWSTTLSLLIDEDLYSSRDDCINRNRR